MIQNTIFLMKLYIKISPKRIILSCISILLSYVDMIYFSGFFVKHILESMEKGNSFHELGIYVSVVLVVFAIIALFQSYYKNVATPLTNVQIYHSLNKMLYEKANSMDLECYENPKFYEKYLLALDSAENQLKEIVEQLWKILWGGCATVFVICYMFTIDHFVFLFFIFPIIGNFVFGIPGTNYFYQMYERIMTFVRKKKYIMRVIHLADYAKEIRLTNVSRLLKKKYAQTVEDEIESVEIDKYKRISRMVLYNIFTYVLFFEGLLIYGGYKTIITGTMSLAQLAVLTGIMVSGANIMIGFSENLITTMRSANYIQNLRLFMAYEPNIQENEDGLKPEEVKTLEFRNVSFAYGEEYVIKNISFKVRRGEKTAIVGHNGSGKTTLMKLLFRFYDPSEGEILLNGIDIRKYRLSSYRKLFAAAFQDYKVYALPVIQNVLMETNTEKYRETAKKALQKASLYEKIINLPQQMDTVLTKEFDDNGAVLSGGEQQKLSVARAFAHDVPIKIYDEPSSALDPIAEYQLFESIREDGENCIMFYISHRLSSVQNADRVILLEHGKIVETGTHKELMQLNRKYAKMYKMQAENYLSGEKTYADSVFATPQREGGKL